MLSQLGHAPRFIRLTVLVTIVVLVPTLYLLYPTPEHVPSPGEVQAGGIDSEHWREPIQPDLNLGVKDYRGQEEQEYVREWQDGASSGTGSEAGAGGHGDQRGWKGVSEETLSGGVIMPKLGNETAKAELGRSAWKVLHLMTLRYPDEPTEDDRQALKSFFHLFSRLYPCGECAAEFQLLLKEYPPQTSSRKSASLWLCHVHNLVNERLGKPEFDCLTLDATYDCGCGDESASVTLNDGVSLPTETALTLGAEPAPEAEGNGLDEEEQDESLEGNSGTMEREREATQFGPQANDESSDATAHRPIPHSHEVKEAQDGDESEDDTDNIDEGGKAEAPTHDREMIDSSQEPEAPAVWERADQRDDGTLGDKDRDDDGIHRDE
ncbi:hypothetical protein IAU59_003279 [Kwoniella sp. CBS 9459]